MNCFGNIFIQLKIFYKKPKIQHIIPQITKFSKPSLPSSPNFSKCQIIVITKTSSSEYSVFEFSSDVLPYNIIKIFFFRIKWNSSLKESQMMVIKNYKKKCIIFHISDYKFYYISILHCTGKTIIFKIDKQIKICRTSFDFYLRSSQVGILFWVIYFKKPRIIYTLRYLLLFFRNWDILLIKTHGGNPCKNQAIPFF